MPRSTGRSVIVASRDREHNGGGSSHFDALANRGRPTELDAPAESETEVSDRAGRHGADVVVRRLDAERSAEAPFDVRAELTIFGEAGRDVRANIFGETPPERDLRLGATRAW